MPERPSRSGTRSGTRAAPGLDRRRPPLSFRDAPHASSPRSRKEPGDRVRADGAGHGFVPGRWRRGMPVPVMFSLPAWDPTARISLHSWMKSELLKIYPSLRQLDSDVVARLVSTHRVLPVLDDFDGLAPQLRPAVIKSLNSSVGPSDQYLLLSRRQEYGDAVAAERPLKKASVVLLEGLTVADYADYLPLSAVKTGGGSGTRWDPVLARLRSEPDAPETGALRGVFSTALGVSLARRVYSDATGAAANDPAELLDPERFPDQTRLQHHLLSAFVDAAYEQPLADDQPAAHRAGYPVAKARQWLGWLAADLNRRETRSLAWWDQNSRLPRPLFALTGLLHTMATMLLSGYGASLVGIDAHMPAFAYLPLVAVLYWAHFPYAQRLSTTFIQTAKRQPRSGFHRRLVVRSLFSGVFMTIATPVPLMLIFEHFSAKDIGFPAACLLGLGAGIWSFGKSWVDASMEPVNIAGSPNPSSLLRTARWSFLYSLSTVWLSVFLCSFVAVLALGSTTPTGILRSVSVTLWFCVVALTLLFLICPWGFFVQTRLWLALTGRLPLRFMTFLDDAHQRGILRQNGAVYEFRHAYLQEYLAAGE
ncbi:hypothetical protein ABZ079_16040 [Streptomyces sp. NPDC006314]|uniref:hypothetical protein n=1 Tax=Streptomyces sp. NPDC006314 TaxID=3154475 RepID=UPI0033A58221